MGKKKSSTTQSTNQTQNTSQNQAFNSQNSYDWLKPPDTADVSAFRDWRPQIDPGLGYQYANARNKLRSSFINPLGGYQTAGMSDALQRSGERTLNQDEAQAFRGGQYDVNQQRSGQLGMLAGITAPRLVGTGTSGTSSGTSSGTATGSGTSTTIQSGDLLGQILGGASQVGSAALLTLLMAVLVSLFVGSSSHDKLVVGLAWPDDHRGVAHNTLSIWHCDICGNHAVKSV